MVKILITGASCVRNKGAAAMVVSTTRFFQTQLDNVEFTLVSPFAEDVEKVQAAKYGIHVQSQPRKPMRLLCWALLSRLGLPCFRCDLFDLYKKSDLVLDLSGDNLTQSFRMPFRAKVLPQVKQLYWVILGLIFNVPTVLYAQSIGPVRHRIPRAFLKYVLKRASLIIVRDDMSRAFIEGMGLTNAHLGADAAFLLQPSSVDVREQVLECEGIALEGAVVGVSLSQDIASFLRVDYDEYIRCMAEFIDYIHSKTSAVVLLVPHVVNPDGLSEDKDDVYTSKKVVSRVDKHGRCLVVQGDYGPEVLKAIIGLADVFVGCRMHSNIAALSMCIPTLAISYSHKYKGIMNMLGQGEYELSLDGLEFELLKSKFDALWENKEEIKTTLKARLADAEALAENNGRLVKQLL